MADIDISVGELPEAATFDDDSLLVVENQGRAQRLSGKILKGILGGWGGNGGLIVVRLLDLENNIANYSASDIKKLADKGNEIVFRTIDADGSFAEWKLWRASGNRIEFRANTNIIAAESRLLNTHVFVDNNKKVWFDESSLVIPDAPVRGVDYWTEADKQEIIAAVLAALGGNVPGTSDTTAVLGKAKLGIMILGKE